MGPEAEKAEQSIVKKYRRRIWLPFLDAGYRYRLLSEGDRVAGCISGGKDSSLTAMCMRRLQKYSDFPFRVEYVVMDPGYSPENRQRILENAELLELPVHVFDTRIYDIVAKTDRTPCYLCAKMRRGYLYKFAAELGCNKIALGHHYDDVIETILMSVLYGAEVRTMMPKLRSTGHPGMELIRPLYRVRESDVVAWRDYNGLQFIKCACRLTENCALGDSGVISKRQEVKELLRRLRRTNPNIDKSIFHSVENVNLEAVVGYRDARGLHSFLDSYGGSGDAGGEKPH